MTQWKIPDAGNGSGHQRASEDETADQHHGCNEHELRQTQGDGEGQGGLEFWGCKKSDTTGRLNNITTIHICVRLLVGRQILCDKKGIFFKPM